MEEKELNIKQNGMAVLLGILALYVLLTLGIFASARFELNWLITVIVILMCLIWIPLCGLKVVNPQEALVLTLFGKYTGTLRKPGFYYVNPFSVAVNPAADTKLGQSGDVDDGGTRLRVRSASAQSSLNVSKKISLKAMTLSNAKQKVNDVLGNPVEISVAVIWQVKDTAKAVFNVDNYKE